MLSKQPLHKLASFALGLVACLSPARAVAQADGLAAWSTVMQCFDTYRLHSYRGTSEATVTITSDDGSSRTYHTSAQISCAYRPLRIRIEGTDMSAHHYIVVSDGTSNRLGMNTWLQQGGAWHKCYGLSEALDKVIWTAQGAATTIPALLTGSMLGSPFTYGLRVDPQMSQETIDGKVCDRISTLSLPKETFWIDRTKHLMKRLVTDSEQSGAHLVRIHSVETFTDVQTDQPIADSTFDPPATQPAPH